MNSYDVKKVVTICPHCFNTIRNEYPHLGGNYEVLHYTEFVNDLIREGKIRPVAEINTTVAYHDSCYLGRPQRHLRRAQADSQRHTRRPARRDGSLPRARLLLRCGRRSYVDRGIQGSSVSITPAPSSSSTPTQPLSVSRAPSAYRCSKRASARSARTGRKQAKGPARSSRRKPVQRIALQIQSRRAWVYDERERRTDSASGKEADMVTARTRRKFTYEDYRNTPDDVRYELLDGELVLVPAPNMAHQGISTILLRLIATLVYLRKLGKVFHAPVDVVFSDTDTLQPDIDLRLLGTSAPISLPSRTSTVRPIS